MSLIPTRDGRVKDNLSQPVTIPEIDEYQTAMIPSFAHPATERDLIAQVLDSQLATGMGSNSALML